MTIFLCKQEWEDMLTCIYEAWTSRRGHNNIRLCLEPLNQYSLFDEYIHVEADADKAAKVTDAINTRISPFYYWNLCYISMSAQEDVLDIIYRMLLLGFHYGPSAVDMYQYKETLRFFDIKRSYSNEVHSFREFLRFHELPGGIYVAHIEPKSRVVWPLGNMFADRMPSEHFMIVDDVHLEAVVHPRDSECYIRRLTVSELCKLLESERVDDEYTDLWKVFFDSIAIKERYNPRCQRNLFPIWFRKHVTEFASDK